MNDKIQVVAYDESWPHLFEKESALVREALKSNCLEVYHIGSTSIPGMAAKPIIDMMPVVRDILKVDDATKAMVSLGYIARGEYGIAFRRFFQKNKVIRSHNVHVYEENDPEVGRYLKFRDWMRTHTDDAKAYANLKKELAEKFATDIMQYCNGKEDFVISINAKDGYDGSRMVKALTDREWLAVRQFRQKYFFKGNVDPYSEIFDHKDHVHFVFSKCDQIIGYVHLHLWKENEAALKIIVIDESYRNLGFGSHLLQLCERWLSHQGFKILHLQSTPKAFNYYQTYGYVKMPFRDPDGYATDIQDIEMGKLL